MKNPNAPTLNYSALRASAAFFNPRALLAFTLCSSGVLLAMLSFAATDEAPYRRPGITERVSVASDGTEGNNSSSGPAISADGRHVAFNGTASNLVPGDTNWDNDIFVHDRATGATQWVSMASDGTEANGFSLAPSMSSDARYVAFLSGASNLVPGDTNGRNDVFVHDRETGVTERVSVASGGTEGDGYSEWPSVSADGRYVAFQSGASNLVPGDTNLAADVFVHDRETGTTERVSVASDGAQGSGVCPIVSAARDCVSSQIPAISADGRHVAFQSAAANLIPGDTNAHWDVFVHDRETGTTERVSVASDGADGNDGSFNPAISADGRHVAFEGLASNLIPGDSISTYDVFVHDRATGTTERVSVASDGTEGNIWSVVPAISADGRHVAFGSFAANLVPGDTNAHWDVLVRDRGGSLGVVGTPSVSCTGGSVTVSGRATFSGTEIASAEDPANDGASGAAAAGGELISASLAYRPEDGDIMVRLGLASLPPVEGGLGVLYGLELTVGSANYEVRAQRTGGTTGGPYFGLYRCEPSCTEVAVLKGGMGTTGLEMVVAIPLTTLGAAEGVSLTSLVAYTAFGDATTGPGVPLDDVTLPATILPVHSVSLGIAPVGTPESQVVFNTPATLAAGNFSGTLDVSSLSSGNYDGWTRACLGATCGPAVSSPLIACLPLQPVSIVSRKTHGSIGVFDIDLLTGNPDIECRSGGANGDHQVIVIFAASVTFSSAAVSGGAGSVSSSSVSGNQVTLNLTGVTNAQTITLTLSGVDDGTTSGDVTVPMAVLVGDTTIDGSVNSSDISQTKSQSGQSVSASNFRQDVTANGSINSSDISLVKSKSGTALP